MVVLMICICWRKEHAEDASIKTETRDRYIKHLKHFQVSDFYEVSYFFNKLFNYINLVIKVFCDINV